MAFLPVAVLLALLAGSFVYCLLVIVAALRYLAVKPSPLETGEPVSILKPLAGADEGLEANLRSFFEQDYPEFEILCAVRQADDPALAVFERLRNEYPNIPARSIITGEAPYPNAKVYSLERMTAASRHELLVMSDSDIRVQPNLLRTLAAEFQNSGLGLTTCPYRAVPGRGLWSTLEAIGMNTEFLGGVLVARMIEGMKFAVGPTIAARKRVLEHIGGFDRLKDYLAEDFVMGKFAAEGGHGVGLSSFVIEHRIGSQKFLPNARHRIRWARSSRRSRPAGYAGQMFTNPLPIALLLLALDAGWWPVALLTVLIRLAAAWATSACVLHDPLCARRWYLIPVQDIASVLFWVAGFFGNTITWRGREYRLDREGRFRLIAHGPARRD